MCRLVHKSLEMMFIEIYTQIANVLSIDASEIKGLSIRYIHQTVVNRKHIIYTQLTVFWIMGVKKYD